MKKQRLISILTILFIIFFVTMLMRLCMGAIIRHEFEANKRNREVPFSVKTETLEKPMSFTIYPWSKYKKKNISELSEEQKIFLREKKVAECMTDMINYDDILVADREGAAAVLYDEVRKLSTEDGREYFVWYQTLVEEIYVFAMVNMEGQIFSFHYVTDLECQDEGAVEYVLKDYGEENGEKGFYGMGYRESELEKNRENFLRNAGKKLLEYENLDSKVFAGSGSLSLIPSKLTEENGSILLEYATYAEEDGYMYLYFDEKTRKFSGYHLELY